MLCQEKQAPSIVLNQCAWCGAIKVHGGQYVSSTVRLPLIRTITLVDMEGRESEHPVSHGICDECRPRAAGMTA